MSRRELGETREELEDPLVRRAVTFAYHLRRYQAFYAFAAIWVAMLVFVPSINPLNDGGEGGVSTTGLGGYDDATNGGFAASGDQAQTSAAGATAPRATVGGNGRGGDDATTSASSSGSAAPASGAVAARSGGSGDTAGGASTDDAVATAGDGAGKAVAAPAASGTTRGLGVECNEGDQRQIPWSAYAAPCVPQHDGGNGGATYRGVDAETIKLVWRKFPESANSRAVAEVNSQAGFADADVRDQVRVDFFHWFNQVYELYGRQVELIEYESENGNSTDEAQSKGKEGACLDADKIAKEIKAFAVWEGGGSPFAECAAERGLVHFNGAAYFPESFYRKYHPFVYHRIMECERISYQVAEYIGKRLSHKKAIYAKDALYQNQERYFGTYVPDNDGYQHCVQITANELQNRYDTDPGARYNYILDVSRFADEAAKAVVQFKAAGVTTLVMAMDPISMIFMTQQAEAQRWGPEWISIGVAATDTDNYGRLYTQTVVDGHLFGMSQLSDINLLVGPDSEAGETYRAIPADQRTYEDMPEGTNGEYYDLLHIFNGLQLAGTDLTPQTIFEGYCQRYRPGTGAAGLWAFDQNPDGTPGCDHTAVEDSREVYWDGSATGPDGDQGTFIETYGGKRFRNGEWPREDPPVYPNK